MSSIRVIWTPRVLSLVAVFIATLLTMAVISINPAQAISPRASSKVTICHRTHAVTNPYRRITVNISSIITNGSNGHDAETHNPFYGDGDRGGSDTGNARRVFDPTFTYPNNQKQWQDIIPAFSYEQGGNTIRFPGLNWDPSTSAGQAIYYGLNYGGHDYAGVCGVQGASEFYNSELEQWKAENPGYSANDLRDKKREIIADLKEQKAEGDPDPNVLNNSYDPNDLPTEPRKPQGPQKPTEFNDLISQIQTQNQGNDGSDPAHPINQALAGVVWKDMNENGIQDGGEETFDVVGIQVLDPDTGEPLNLSDLNIVPAVAQSSNPVFKFATWRGGQPVFTTAVTTITVHTVNGYFEIPSIPEGEWKIVVITPEGWSYTYDSAGGGDGLMPGTYVPLGGVGFAWAGLVWGTGSNGEDPSLSNTGTNPIWLGTVLFGIVAISGGIAMAIMRRRLRK